ncbi:MAG: ribonuclease P protein component [Nitrososphaeraceae archaeon]
METLKKKRDFDNLFKKGKYINCDYFKVISGVSDKNADRARFGYIINKRFGNAVKRNKIKRQLKEIFRSIEKDSIEKMDFLIIVKNSITDLEYSEIKKAFMKSMREFIH